MLPQHEPAHPCPCSKPRPASTPAPAPAWPATPRTTSQPVTLPAPAIPYPSPQAALTDSNAGVREAAGAAFGILFRGAGGGGGSAVDGVVPAMLAGLEHDKRYRESLEGLRVILQVGGRGGREEA